jgi:glyoxylase-like metal-dependent hydrolase (beta-lactamase superfamily II)
MAAPTVNTQYLRHWTVGDVQVARIVEIFPFQVPAADLFNGGTPELIQRYPWLLPHHATPDGQIIFAFQAFVVRSRGRRIMVDTCLGNDKSRMYDVFTNLQTSFLKDLEIAGTPAESIDTVLCTHLHQDHVGWNTKLVEDRWVPTFPNARYLFGRSEWAHWAPQIAARDGHPDEPAIHLQHLSDSVEPLLEAGLVDFVESDHHITDEVWLEPTPGHTPGHVSVHIASRGQEAVITGDVMHHPIQCAEPDLPTHFCFDHELSRQTRRAFLERYGDRPVLVIGSHFADPTVGRVVRDGATWRFSGE